jgi:hypothetical protein
MLGPLWDADGEGQGASLILNARIFLPRRYQAHPKIRWNLPSSEVDATLPTLPTLPFASRDFAQACRGWVAPRPPGSRRIRSRAGGSDDDAPG